MFRAIISFFVFLICTSESLDAQTNDLHEVKYAYSNEGFLQPRLNTSLFSKTGFVLFEGRSSVKLMSISQARLLQDSNAYSVVNFNLGTIATQNIGIEMLRPISLNNVFSLNVYRESNPGWVAKSFVRRTDVDLSYNHDFNSRLRLSNNVGIHILDREQNGGVTDTTMYNLASRGPTELNLEGNVWLTNAYNRRSHFEHSLLGEYDIVQRGYLDISASLRSELQHQRYVYRDDQPDSSFYSNFLIGGGVVGSVFDSTRITSLLLTPGMNLTYERTDTLSIGMFIGIDQSWNWLKNNSMTSSPMNQAIVGNFDFEMSKIAIGSGLYTCFEGYNQGDYRLDVNQKIRLNKTDSTDFRLFMGLDQLIQVRRPARIYERFESNVLSNDYNLQKQGSQRYSGNFSVESRMLKVKITGEYLNLKNFVYFNERAVVRQRAHNIETYSAEIQLGVYKPFMSLSASGRYQWNDRSKHYSLPEWINRNSLCFYWSLLNKKLRMTSGLSTLYFSGYYNPGYLPFFDVLYTQSFHRFDDYFQVDLFLGAQIKSVNVGLKAYNVMYGILDENPIIAPNTPSIPRYFSLQFQWNFKN